ncbi:hypothetical protein PYCCODRAFT_701601 [Trametes coccinea BRFM310]|uniref:Uncharacterized protein n=1 Tax=Trametes coccinea (strain BRFM310) TaxID=1353009 RepID=A0A1Y2IIM1_TRAC3|nr:hypothetical protein PYCCODRAFT_701601 [Trametes coccinea BRFM310]
MGGKREPRRTNATRAGNTRAICQGGEPKEDTDWLKGGRVRSRGVLAETRWDGPERRRDTSTAEEPEGRRKRERTAATKHPSARAAVMDVNGSSWGTNRVTVSPNSVGELQCFTSCQCSPRLKFFSANRATAENDQWRDVPVSLRTSSSDGPEKLAATSERLYHMWQLGGGQLTVQSTGNERIPSRARAQ